jgi:sporulation protein YlmC with PRC-barrel domain
MPDSDVPLQRQCPVLGWHNLSRNISNEGSLRSIKKETAMKTNMIALLSSTLLTGLTLNARGQQGINEGHPDTAFFSHPVRSSKIIGKGIDDFQGRKLGKVKDLIIDLDNGRVVEVIVAQENLMGGDKRMEAVPPDVLTPTGSGRIVYSSLNKKELALSPAVDFSQWDNAVAQPRLEAVYQYFGETPYFLMPEHADKAVNESTTHRLGTLRRASEILGLTTVNKQEERIGKVEDLVVDLSDGRVAELVISTGSYLGTNGELSAIPPQALRMKDDHSVVLDTTRDRLDAAPRFSEKTWPEFDRDQIVSVYQAYHVLPYPPSNGMDAKTDGTHGAQMLDQPDGDITSKISQAIQAAEGLSSSARQVSVTTVGGRVVLRGVVASQQEKLQVGEIAARTVANIQIDNQIVIKEAAASAFN